MTLKADTINAICDFVPAEETCVALEGLTLMRFTHEDGWVWRKLSLHDLDLVALKDILLALQMNEEAAQKVSAPDEAVVH